MAIVTGLERALEILRSARTIAVLGAHVDPDRAATYVPDYLLEHGYRILPVNPHYVGRTMWGERCVGLVTELGAAVDLVDVFRPGPLIDMHVPEILAMQPLPGAVWFQLGIRNDGAAAALAAAGIDVVQDRCTLADHERYLAT